MRNLTKKSILKLKQSSTLVINEKCKDLISKGKKVYQFGFGQSPFPVPKKIVDALRENAHRKEYLPIQGLESLRSAISKDIKNKIGINYPKENIVITPGSKEAMLLEEARARWEVESAGAARAPCTPCESFAGQHRKRHKKEQKIGGSASEMGSFNTKEGKRS